MGQINAFISNKISLFQQVACKHKNDCMAHWLKKHVWMFLNKYVGDRYDNPIMAVVAHQTALVTSGLITKTKTKINILTFYFLQNHSFVYLIC